jgi:hypothetical protein
MNHTAMIGRIIAAMLLMSTAGLQGSGPLSKQLSRIAARDFQTSDRCMACHNGITTTSGDDISFGFSWRPTMMANSARDPYWQGGVRREILDHPSAREAIEDECSICHMPMARYEAHMAGLAGQVFAFVPFNLANSIGRLAADGVSCTVCHRIEPENFGTRASFVGRFVVKTFRQGTNPSVYGPFAVDQGRASVMLSSSGFQPAEGEHVRQSELCAICHTLYTKPIVDGAADVEEFPEQVPYQEWLHSDYRSRRSCQSCHMPAVQEEAPVTSVLAQVHPSVARHTFLGGNFFMPRLFGRYGPELGVVALPQEFEAAASRTIAHLQAESARISIQEATLSDGVLRVNLLVENLTGHKLPTAYPSRRVWVHFVVRDRQRRIVFESGALNPDGSIAGNDNDASPSRFEPHYREIRSADQVQIYESILGDASGRVTTGLLNAVGYLKDNRLLPRGFDKRSAAKEIMVYGEAASDPNFLGGGDSIRYVVGVRNAQGPYHVDVELYYQPIGYRWASNLRPYNAGEPQRFVSMYDAMAKGSAVVLSRAWVSR